MKKFILILGLLALSPLAKGESDPDSIDPGNRLDAGHVVQEYEATEEELEFKQQCLREFPNLIKEAQDCRQFECIGFTAARELGKSEKTATQSRKEDEKAWKTYRNNECWNSRISKENCLEAGGKIELPAGSAKKTKPLPIRDVWCLDVGTKGHKTCIGSQFCVENWAP